MTTYQERAQKEVLTGEKHHKPADWTKARQEWYAKHPSTNPRKENAAEYTR